MPPAPAGPEALNKPIHRPLALADVVHVQILYMHEVEDVVDRGIRAGVARFARHVAGTVHVVEWHEPAFRFDGDTPIPQAIIQEAYEMREHRLPSDVLIVVIDEWEGAPPYAAAIISLEPDGGTLIKLRASRIDYLIERTPLVTRRNGWRLVVQHELGHGLNLPLDRNRRTECGHCTQPECLMYREPDWRSITTSLMRLGPGTLDYCRRCRTELREARNIYGLVDREQFGRYDPLADADEIVRLNEHQPRAYRRRAEVHGSYGDIPAAIADHERILQLQPDNILSIEWLAYRLATLPDDNLRDGHRAVELARHGCEVTQWQRPITVGVLAAASAEVGDFEQAVALQAQLVDNPNFPFKGWARERLTAYELGQAWREPWPDGMGDGH